MTAKNESVSHWDEVYGQVMALYYAFRDSQGFQVRRAEMKQGEVKAEPLDFVMDVELKAARALTRNISARVEWNKVLSEPENYRFLPVLIREQLGEVFEKNKLGPTGAYKVLFYRNKGV